MEDGSFNRTFMELKFGKTFPGWNQFFGFNRTFMELKCAQYGDDGVYIQF